MTLTNADIAYALLKKDKRRITLRGLLRLTLEMDGYTDEEIKKVLGGTGYMVDAGETYLQAVKKIRERLKGEKNVNH